MSDPYSLANAFSQDAADKRIEVLRKIAETGSISKAARDAGISYKAAWQAIDTLTNLTGATLVEKSVGGAGGGGAKLTADGHRLLELAGQLEKSRNEVLDRFREEKPDTISARVARLAIRTSMRNYLPCHVKSLKMSGQIVRVCLQLSQNMLPLIARITRTSAELLALKPGMPVLAMCKATAVRIYGDEGPGAISAANQLQGVVTCVSASGQEDEVMMEILPGLHLVGFAQSSLKTAEGETVHAAVDESAVVIALLP